MSVIERITRTVFTPAYNFKVKHQVSFGIKNEADQKRRGELNKYEYSSNRYSDITRLTSLNLETSDYLVLEKTNYVGGEKDTTQILISYPHLYRFKRTLRDAVSWFNDTEFADVFIYKDKEVYLNSKYKGLQAEAYRLVGNSTIAISPHILEIENEMYEGVIMYMNSYNNFVEMTIDQLEALYDFVDSFRLYEASQLLINYVANIQKPESTSMNLNKNTGQVTSSHKESMPLIKKTRSKASVQKAKIEIDLDDIDI